MSNLKRKNYWPIRATLVETNKGKLILYLSVHQFDLEKFCLEEGKQPDDLFSIVVSCRGKKP